MGEADVAALRAFIEDNEDLDRLETLVDQFNLFASLDLVHHEIRHSAFLRWLLDPSETHGLGDYWLQQFLRLVIKAGDTSSFELPSIFDLDGWDLGQAEVLKEWKHVDVLIRDSTNRFVCVIENKISASEHGQQLQNYRRIVEQAYPDFKKAYVFLTPAGHQATDPEYVALSHRDVASMIDLSLHRRHGQIGDEVRQFIEQYIEMVRRFVVEDSEIHELCRRIYSNHRRALDLIFENRPDRAAEISESLQRYFQSRTDLIPEHSTKAYVRFLHPEMDLVPHAGSDWIPSGRMLLWELENYSDQVKLKLIMGPGPQPIRKRIHDLALENREAFGRVKGTFGRKWATFHAEVWINSKEYADITDEEIATRLDQKVSKLLSGRGKALVSVLKPIEEELKRLADS